MSNTCVCCGREIPEGRQVCLSCEGFGGPDAILKDGTPLYMKTTPSRGDYGSLQLYLYSLLNGGKSK